jgi:ATP-dependent DNA helicase RecG
VPTGDLRPPLLNPLFAPLTTLTGVGPAVAAAAIRLLQRPTPRCLDLLAHLPSGAIDPTPRVTLTGADLGQMVTLRVEIEGHRTGPRSGRAPHRILARVAGEPIDLVFFGARGDHLATRFPVGGKALLHGQLGRFGERWQIAHPEPIDEALAHNGMVPLYPLVQGLGHRRVRTLVRAILDRVPDLPEWLPAGLLRASGWTDWAESIRAAHRPATAADLEPISPARRRLAFDELVASQLALGLMRVARTRLPGRGLSYNGHLAERLINSLPFPLTDCQKRAIAEIGQDLASPAPMLRLLQGDVGSGKTVVAAASMLRAIEAGTQAALMAPTEVLTRQHGATLERLLAPLGLGIALLTGREPTARRRATLAGLATGEVAVAVGTQALLESGVEFRDLGLVVIDEQHRFGVGQRLDLVVKGHAVDVLLMTATPIPRSLVLTLYGDLASSHLLTKPPGRQPITTRALPCQRIEEVLAAIERALQRDERIYWICPLIEGGESDGATAAVERHRQLAELFDGWVGLIHGRLAGPAKAKALDAFAAGSTRLLVATTAIEVGVDVPEASIMVIEHAERFGLAQLHQLRGRVGRGSRPSFCLLLYEPPLGKAARTRIATLRRTEDGFRIAEEDLRLRGPGEVLGMRQSGLPSFRFADLAHHADLLDPAREVADRALAADPGLRRGKSEPLRVLLHLFERHDAVRLLAAG